MSKKNLILKNKFKRYYLSNSLQSTMSLPTYAQLTAHFSSFSKGNDDSYKSDKNRIAKKLSIISAEVDFMVDHPDHPLDFMYQPNPDGYYTDPRTYYDPNSFDEDYEEYNVGFPEDAEDLDDCMVSSDDEDNYD